MVRAVIRKAFVADVAGVSLGECAIFI